MPIPAPPLVLGVVYTCWLGAGVGVVTSGAVLLGGAASGAGLGGVTSGAGAGAGAGVVTSGAVPLGGVVSGAGLGAGATSVPAEPVPAALDPSAGGHVALGSVVLGATVLGAGALGCSVPIAEPDELGVEGLGVAVLDSLGAVGWV